MALREGEEILKVYHHHPTPYVFKVCKVILGSFPFFFLLFLFEPVLASPWFFLCHLILFFIFAFIIIYISFTYWLDKLIITNFRIIFIDWKYLTKRDVTEIFMSDIQDIVSLERGFLSSLKIFDYGTIKIDTPASYVPIEFPQAPDPESIRQFIYHIKKQ